MNTSDIILKHPEFQTSKPVWVSVYESQSVYGGPEEGGWYHTYNRHVGGVRFLSRQEAEAYVETAEQQAAALNSQANRAFGQWYDRRHNDPCEDVEDDFCCGEATGPDDHWVVIEDVRGHLDNTNDPIPRWE